MHTRSKLPIFGSLLLLASLACTALGSADEIPSTTDTPILIIEDSGEPTEGTSDVGDADSGAGAVLEGEACLIGTWQMNNDSYLAFLQALVAASEFADDLSYDSVDGTALVTFNEDGIVSNTLDGFAFTVCSEGTCRDFLVPPSAATNFNYSADSSSLTVEGGQIVAANFGEFEGSDLSGETATYTCSGNTLTTQYATLPPILWERVP
ncbi:MAG: hypothetical protein DWQ07_24920 [Chloroflexi bacterium]|nr:MAG: hypothetical protein DWQ07_24920 [Chloroflexota bacterium]MBL1197064.1 hypothetical protein [Chloroflexota bacterium]NOH14358.1 hypothetical protein [Chloroflexota bacterium]